MPMVRSPCPPTRSSSLRNRPEPEGLCFRAVTLPVVRLTGDPFEQGQQHGLALREQIGRNLDVYYDRFLAEAKLDQTEVRRRALHLLPVLQGQPYYDALRGMAAGSQFDLLDLVVLNL